MKKDIKAVRVELPTELYERFKKTAKENYKTPTSLVRDYIVDYVLKLEKGNE